jgi:hypothetical protein
MTIIVAASFQLAGCKGKLKTRRHKDRHPSSVFANDLDAIGETATAEMRHERFLSELFQVVSADTTVNDNLFVALLDREFPESRNWTVPQRRRCPRLRNGGRYHPVCSFLTGRQFLGQWDPPTISQDRGKTKRDLR